MEKITDSRPGVQHPTTAVPPGAPPSGPALDGSPVPAGAPAAAVEIYAEKIIAEIARQYLGEKITDQSEYYYLPVCAVRHALMRAFLAGKDAKAEDILGDATSRGGV